MRSMPRREFLAASAALVAGAGLAPAARPRVAGLATVYYHNSHADMHISRLMQGYTLDGRGEFPSIDLASLYLDQRPESDKGVRLAREHGVPLFESVGDALTLGTGKLAVDGVLLIAEHGEYPRSPLGSLMYPKRRLFAEVVEVFRESGRVVPVFIDKHLSDNREDIAWIYGQARALKIPLMAGSVLPVARREPPEDIKAGEPAESILALSYHTLDAYGFHALELVQALAERRRGGEAGVRSVQSTSGPDVWKALDAPLFDRELLAGALARLPGPPVTIEKLPGKVPEPILWQVVHADNFHSTVLTLNGVVGSWTAAWRTGGGEVRSVGFDTREERPMMHFTWQLKGVEAMIQTGRPSWPVERTLLTSGLLDSLLTSAAEGGRRLDTPHLAVPYRTDWAWTQPPPNPPGRPVNEQ